MENKKSAIKTIDEYILQFQPEAQSILMNLRRFIKVIVPEATEKISYQMPAFYLNGNLVYFAAHKNHIGFYPTASGIEHFKDKLQGYVFSKGAIQFPLGKPLPYDLIGEIVAFRADENRKKTSGKK